MNKEKLFFKISELEELTGITSTKIRYWTKKYKELNSQLRETPNSTHKLYHKDSIEIIITIDSSTSSSTAIVWDVKGNFLFKTSKNF